MRSILGLEYDLCSFEVILLIVQYHLHPNSHYAIRPSGILNPPAILSVHVYIGLWRLRLFVPGCHVHLTYYSEELLDGVNCKWCYNNSKPSACSLGNLHSLQSHNKTAPTITLCKVLTASSSCALISAAC